MNTITRRIAAGATLAIAPALIALGVAGAGHAETAPADNGPSISAPAHKLATEPGAPAYRQDQNRNHGSHHRHAG